MIRTVIEKLIDDNRQQVQTMQHVMAKVLAGRLSYSVAVQNLTASINAVNSQMESTVHLLNTREGIPADLRQAIAQYIHAVRHDLSVPIGYLELMDHSQPIAPNEMADSLALIRRRLQLISGHVERFDSHLHQMV